MLFDLCGRCGRRDRRFFPYRATVLTPMVLLTTVGCSTLPADIRQPFLAFAECDLFSGLVTENPRQQVLQREAEAAKRRREQPSTSAAPKVATVRAPNATSQPASGDAAKKASTPRRLDVEKERQLFKEFLDWRGRQVDL